MGPVPNSRELSEFPLSELLGVLSFGVDLGMGQPMEHVLRQCLIALRMAEKIGLGAGDLEAVYFASLVAWVGSHVDAYERAKWFGDDSGGHPHSPLHSRLRWRPNNDPMGTHLSTGL